MTCWAILQNLFQYISILPPPPPPLLFISISLMNTLQFPATEMNTVHNIVLPALLRCACVCARVCVRRLVRVCTVFVHVFDRESEQDRMRWQALIKIDGSNQSVEQLAMDEWAEGVHCVFLCATVSGLLVNIVIVHLSVHVDTEQETYGTQP